MKIYDIIESQQDDFYYFNYFAANMYNKLSEDTCLIACMRKKDRQKFDFIAYLDSSPDYVKSYIKKLIESGEYTAPSQEFIKIPKET